MSVDSFGRRPRGRPPREDGAFSETRERLVRAGVAMLCERGFAASGLDQILQPIGVPKGSFYYYFASKEEFGSALISSYASYFARKLDRWLLETSRPPLARLVDFIEDASAGMERFEFHRGCLVGNLGQELAVLPEAYRAQLNAVFQDWQLRTQRCLEEARAAGEIRDDADCRHLAEFFWIGWEGAVLRAKLDRSAAPLDSFACGFFAVLGRPDLMQH